MVDVSSSTPWADYLKEAIEDLEEGVAEELKQHLGQPLEIEVLQEQEYLDKARKWVADEIDSQEDPGNLPMGIFRLRGALYVFRSCEARFAE